MTQPELNFEYKGTIINAIKRCKQADQLEGGGRASADAWDIFLQYHTKNPKLFTAFRKFTQEAINAGVKRLGPMTIIERIRWCSLVQSEGTDYKISNTATPFYARTFMEFDAQHQGFFNVHNRPLRGLIKGKLDVEAIRGEDYDNPNV